MKKVYKQTGTSRGIKIAYDSIAYCPSGLVDANKGHVLSYLHKVYQTCKSVKND